MNYEKNIQLAIGTAAVLIALVLNFHHSMNDYGMCGNLFVKAFAEGDDTSHFDSTNDDPEKKVYYQWRNTNEVCTVNTTTTATHVITTPDGVTTVTDQSTIQYKGLYFICEKKTDGIGMTSCTPCCLIFN